MKITGLTGGGLPLPKPVGGGPDFGQALTDALKGLNQTLGEATESQVSLVLGHDVELHQVMLATERASLALELTMAIRNKVVEAYQEIARMQM